MDKEENQPAENNQPVEKNQPVETSKTTPTIRYPKVTMAVGAVAVLSLGMLLGIATTKHVAGIPVAVAATKTLKDAPPPVAAPAKATAAATEWNPFQEMRDMQLRMDQMFDRMNDQFRLEPRLSLFKENPGYSLSLRVQDLKDRYEVRAYLPNAKASDVSASLLDKQTLKVEVANKTTEKASTKGENEQVTEWGKYAQIIQLPAPVKSEAVKVDQAKHELIVTLPKA
jgi:HSP20 family molecular chaperone IbpA